MSNVRYFPPYNDPPPKDVTIHSYHQKYQQISNLGNGSFGTVELAKIKFSKIELLESHSNKVGTMMFPLEESKRNTSNFVAIKTMKKKLSHFQDYSKVKELNFILTVPSHPCLVQIFEVFIDDINFQLHIAMEALNQNLYQLIKSRRADRFSPTTLKSILSQLLCAIKHIHKNNYFHRDVKPENILIIPTLHYYGSKDLVPPYRKYDNFIIKLGDYGLARHASNMKPYTAYVSTRWYRSPEILLRQNWYSFPIDIWAFGTVAAEVVNFTPLFPGANELDQIWKILKVIGSPMMPDFNQIGSNYVVPIGGLWEEATNFALKLGLILPMEPGLKITEVVQCESNPSLLEVIRCCLLWDPNARPTVFELSEMSYFKDFIKMLEKNYENESTPDLKFNGISNSPSSRKTATIIHDKSVLTINDENGMSKEFENYFSDYMSPDLNNNSEFLDESYYEWFNANKVGGIGADSIPRNSRLGGDSQRQLKWATGLASNSSNTVNASNDPQIAKGKETRSRK
ncbi:IME2 [Candida pseudojiufengensis]|uniref:IME2 n=1 Tax=Candida pseudojiufengensis TaxID=497109 RepID=UPI002224B2D2|nr:IME2 [Candida pseudojiufengensis]KAI5963596.1 IME2 [Candida pseudojiufengensis]